MRMAVIFGMNQVISHGFGLFLFAALVPMMRESITISHWYLAAIGALTQAGYLLGAMVPGILSHKIGADRLTLAAGALTTLLLLVTPGLTDPLIITVSLTLMAFSSAISWGSIVGLISHYADITHRSTYLSSASSGTAWGYGINGLMILVLVPILGWESAWYLAGLTGIITVSFTYYLLKQLKQAEFLPNQTSQTNNALDTAQDTTEITQEGIEITPENAEPTLPTNLPFKQLLHTIKNNQTAYLACLICFLVGFITMPFSSWLNTYLDELALPASQGGYTWSVAGAAGMAAGFLMGKLADKKGHATTFILVFTGFALGLSAFIYQPETGAIWAGMGYGLMYFPMWGLIAGWLNKHFNTTQTMQINGIGLVTFGLGGILGNLMTGYLMDLTGSLQSAYMVLTAGAFILVFIAGYIWYSERKDKKAGNVENSYSPTG